MKIQVWLRINLCWILTHFKQPAPIRDKSWVSESSAAIWALLQLSPSWWELWWLFPKHVPSLRGAPASREEEGNLIKANWNHCTESFGRFSPSSLLLNTAVAGHTASKGAIKLFGNSCMAFWHNVLQATSGKMHPIIKYYQAVVQHRVQKDIKFSMAKLSGRILRQKDGTRLRKGKNNQGGKLKGGNFLPAVFIDSVKKMGWGSLSPSTNNWSVWCNHSPIAISDFCPGWCKESHQKTLVWSLKLNSLMEEAFFFSVS